MTELKFKAAIFDLDGTLACTLPDLTYSLNTMLAKTGYPTLDQAGVLRSVNYTVREFIRLALPESVQSDESEIDRCLDIYTGIYSEHFCDHTYIYEGLSEVIAAMKEHGAVYFGAIGGCGALLSQCIKKAEVIAYEDLGAEAIRRLEVEDFPVVVIIDSEGNNLYESGRAEYLNSLK